MPNAIFDALRVHRDLEQLVRVLPRALQPVLDFDYMSLFLDRAVARGATYRSCTQRARRSNDPSNERTGETSRITGSMREGISSAGPVIVASAPNSVRTRAERGYQVRICWT